jgi:hypothetical protein
MRRHNDADTDSVGIGVANTDANSVGVAVVSRI